MSEKAVEKRSEPRKIADKYYSVEFSIQDLDFSYQFKIWNISSKGICVMVKEDSDLLNHLKVGQVLDLKYSTTDASDPVENLKTEIKHISKDEEGRFKGLYLIGLSILESKNSESPGNMSVFCPLCNAGYKIITNKIRPGKRGVATCKKCGGKIEIPPPGINK
ncbi:MAG: PilZ domain-containing protein [Desulfobacteraceae bacterium]|nr:PilZ domain-containing protein [Desulfobacteraceae bacterium]